MGFNTGNEEKLSYSQAKPGQASCLAVVSPFPVLNPTLVLCHRRRVGVGSEVMKKMMK